MRAVDIFSGCGGMTLGFEQAGIDVVAAFDKWAPAVEIYRANFNHPILRRIFATATASKPSNCLSLISLSVAHRAKTIQLQGSANKESGPI